jgi:hypothetical protein
MVVPDNVWPNFIVEGLLVVVFVVFLFLGYPENDRGDDV